MKTATTKQKVTISLDSDVYEGLISLSGPRGIGAYISEITRPHLISKQKLEDGYKAMALHEKNDPESREWLDAPIDAELPDEPKSAWQF